jgi:hypothetical protein
MGDNGSKVRVKGGKNSLVISAAALVGRFHLLIPDAETVMETGNGQRELATPAGSPHRWPSFRERLYDSPATPKLPLRSGFTLDTTGVEKWPIVSASIRVALTSKVLLQEAQWNTSVTMSPNCPERRIPRSLFSDKY